MSFQTTPPDGDSGDFTRILRVTLRFEDIGDRHLSGRILDQAYDCLRKMPRHSGHTEGTFLLLDEGRGTVNCHIMVEAGYEGEDT